MTRSDQVAARVSTVVREASSTTHAGVVTRVLAACVDLAVVVGATVAVDLAAAGIRFAWAPMAFRWPQPAPTVAVAAVVAVAVVYLAVAWATTGRTYGGRLLGLRTVSTGHTRLGWTRSVLRALACVLVPLGLLWCGVSRDRRSLQDLLLGTIVLYDSSPWPDTGTGRPHGAPRTRR